MASSTILDATPHQGIRPNWVQFVWLMANTLLVGAVVGLERSVLPVLGRDVYHLGPAVTLSFLISFGLAKAPLNLVAGTLSDNIGRHRVLIAGWLLGFPMMALLLGVEHWWAVVLANVFLGANQALAWTMTVNMQMDLASPRQRGLAMGINEATGYTGVALATMATGFIAARFGVRHAPFLFGSAVVVVGLLLSVVVTRETRHLVVHEKPPASTGSAAPASFAQVFWWATLRDPALSSATLGGFVNKLADALAWGAVPWYLATRGLPVAQIGVVAGSYALTWGLAQLGTGALSDLIGRKRPIVGGMILLGGGILVFPLMSEMLGWSLVAAAMGLGMALLYPTLNAAVGDVAPPARRGAVMGSYRLWRDGGYAVGGLLVGLLLALAGSTGTMAVVGGLVLLAAFLIGLRMPETHHPTPATERTPSSTV
jgi:MFS family permease